MTEGHSHSMPSKVWFCVSKRDLQPIIIPDERNRMIHMLFTNTFDVLTLYILSYMIRCTKMCEKALRNAKQRMCLQLTEFLNWGIKGIEFRNAEVET